MSPPGFCGETLVEAEGNRKWLRNVERVSEENGSGMIGLGFWYSSTKPERHEGQRGSPLGEGVMLTVRSHWWQKYICELPSATATPAEDIFLHGEIGKRRSYSAYKNEKCV